MLSFFVPQAKVRTPVARDVSVVRDVIIDQVDGLTTALDAPATMRMMLLPLLRGLTNDQARALARSFYDAVDRLDIALLAAGVVPDSLWDGLE